MNAHGQGTKTMNEYAEAVGHLYTATPKAVWAAIAISLATTGGDRLPDAGELVLAEWRALYTVGIVPQEPPKLHAPPSRPN